MNDRNTDVLILDGAHGEGGGQILRSAVTLAALTGRAVRLVNLRARRSTPGLRPQHLTAVRAVAALCAARLEGAALGSQSLVFAPQTAVRPGEYTFDVSDAAQGGSAGAVTLVAQALLLPLALAAGPSRITLRGGTAVLHSPPALYLERVYLPTLAAMGLQARIIRHRWGLYPRGQGELAIEVDGNARLRPLEWETRGELQRVEGVAFASQLPSHIPQRMSDRAQHCLRTAGLRAAIEPQHISAADPGAGIFLLARYAGSVAGFTVLGRKGLPSEAVAEQACAELLAHHRSGMSADLHLADQLVLPCLWAAGVSQVGVAEITLHLATNVWVAQQFDVAAVRIEGDLGGPGWLIVGEKESEHA